MRLTGTEVDLLAHAMSAAVKRHETAAANLANANTPGFKAKEVRFEASFRAALAEGPKAALAVRPEVVLAEGLDEKSDGNNVLAEREYGLMQKNALVFNVMSAALRQKLAAMRHAISGSAR